MLINWTCEKLQWELILPGMLFFPLPAPSPTRAGRAGESTVRRIHENSAICRKVGSLDLQRSDFGLPSEPTRLSGIEPEALSPSAHGFDPGDKRGCNHPAGPLSFLLAFWLWPSQGVNRRDGYGRSTDRSDARAAHRSGPVFRSHVCRVAAGE